MNHRELVEAIAAKMNLPEEQTERLVRGAVSVFSDRLAEDCPVRLQGFGTFEVRKKEERISVQPLTQTRTLIPPKLVVNFRQSGRLKDKWKGLPHE